MLFFCFVLFLWYSESIWCLSFLFLKSQIIWGHCNKTHLCWSTVSPFLVKRCLVEYWHFALKSDVGQKCFQWVLFIHIWKHISEYLQTLNTFLLYIWSVLWKVLAPQKFLQSFVPYLLILDQFISIWKTANLKTKKNPDFVFVGGD